MDLYFRIASIDTTNLVSLSFFTSVQPTKRGSGAKYVRDILTTIPFGTRLDRTLTWLIENHFDCLEAGYKDEYEYPTTVDIAIAKNIAKHSKLQK